MPSQQLNPNFIILNGFAGSGKSSLGKKYIEEHPLGLLIEGDQIIVNMGDWLEHEAEARQNVFELTKSMASTILSRGYDVVVPYLVVDNSHISAFEQIATEHSARFFNFLLFNDQEEAVARLMERGTWGEAGLDPLSEKDLPEINELYSQMEAALEHQPGIIKIDQSGKTIDDSYAEILEHISRSSTNL